MTSPFLDVSTLRRVVFPVKETNKEPSLFWVLFQRVRAELGFVQAPKLLVNAELWRRL